MTFTFDQLTPMLYQGSAPPCEADLAGIGFRALVLAAVEYQPDARCFPGVRIMRAPLDDDAPSAPEIQRAHRAASFVAQAVRRGLPVLVTCAQGLNRSGLISALALAKLGEPPEHAIAHVQACRPGALFNRHFLAVVRSAR